MVYKRSQRKGRARAKPSKRFTTLVKKVIDKQAEHKYVEANVTSLSFDATPAGATVVKNLEIDLTGQIAQGVAVNQRIGERIKLMGMEFRAVFVPTTATTGAVRLIIGQAIDEQLQTAMTLTYGEILSQLSGAGDFSCITSAYEHEPQFKYKLLMDEVITWDAQNTAAPRVISKRFNRFPVKVRNYDGSSNNLTGSFFYMLLSANSVAATLKYPTCKITYTDV